LMIFFLWFCGSCCYWNCLSISWPSPSINNCLNLAKWAVWWVTTRIASRIPSNIPKILDTNKSRVSDVQRFN
jgi:hypothetical protein